MSDSVVGLAPTITVAVTASATWATPAAAVIGSVAPFVPADLCLLGCAMGVLREGRSNRLHHAPGRQTRPRQRRQPNSAATPSNRRGDTDPPQTGALRAP